MIDAAFLAYRYLRFHWVQTLCLVACVTVLVYLPLALWVLAAEGERHLFARAAQTPLLIAARGSATDNTVNALYFQAKSNQTLPYSEVARVQETGLAMPIPLYVRFRTQADPIVATTLDYFRFRGLTLESGAQLTRLGDCVLGANVARRRQLKPGDRIVSRGEQVFDLAGVPPLMLRIVGVLAPANSPDDDAVFLDLKTAWIIEGIGHGHNDDTPGAAVQPFTEITDANRDSFHFHGEESTFPISAILAVAPDEKSATRLIGRYQTDTGPAQMIEPPKVIGELLQTIATVKTFALVAMTFVAVAVMILFTIIQLLLIRLRRRERELLECLGANRRRTLLVFILESLSILFAGGLLACALTWITRALGTATLRNWLTN